MVAFSADGPSYRRDFKNALIQSIKSCSSESLTIASVCKNYVLEISYLHGWEARVFTPWTYEVWNSKNDCLPHWYRLCNVCMHAHHALSPFPSLFRMLGWQTPISSPATGWRINYNLLFLHRLPLCGCLGHNTECMDGTLQFLCQDRIHLAMPL